MSTLVDAPRRVDGVQPLGEMVGSGYRTPPSLVRRADGQVLQVTRLLYEVLQAADGRRSCAEIAEVAGEALDRTITEADVAMLVDKHLLPLGLVRHPDGSEPTLKRSNPLLGLHPRFAITNPRTTQRVTDPFRLLFRPFIVAVVLAAFVAVVGWVFFARGLGASAYDAFERPHLLLLVFVVTVLSGGFHEFGHAAAARYGGAQPGTMGAGLYLVWPAFYTDVTDSYRLGRGGRIRTDLGGLYFNTIVVVLTFVWWWATGWEALLLLVATQVMQMTQQLLPLLRFDGYHLLADLAGVPDLYHRIRPTLVGLLPHRWSSPENRALTPRARAVITFWVLVTVPMMALMLFAVIAAVPRLLGSAEAVARENAAAVSRAWNDANPLDVSANALQLLSLVLTVLACGLILGRVGVRFFGGLSRWSRGSVAKRAVASVVSATVVTVLAYAWWPHPGAYRPIEPGERALVSSLLPPPNAAPAPAGLARPAIDTSGELRAAAAQTQSQLGDEPLVAAFEEGSELPTKDEPQLAIVLIPSDTPATAVEAPASDSEPSPDQAPDEPWVFPFDQPLPPAEGDNQALAVATEDNSMVYDVAFALVWAEGDEVLNVNEAHAYASCSNCIAVAVAFQVVLIMDNAHVVVPQNLAVAANYECYQCITAAIASQLVLSVTETPGVEQLLALGAVWNDIIAFAGSIGAYSLTEITDTLDDFKDEIMAILGEAPVVEPQTSPSAPVASSAGAETSDPTGPTSSSSSSSPTGTATTTEPTPASSSPAPSTPAPSPSEPPASTPTEPSSPTASDSGSAPSPTPTESAAPETTSSGDLTASGSP